MARERRRRRDRRRRNIERVARCFPYREGQEQSVPRHQRRHHRPHRQAMLAQHRTLDVRHLGLCPWHRRIPRQAGQEALVFPDRGLCLWTHGRARGQRGRQGRGWHGRRLGQASPQHAGFLLLLAPGTGVEGRIIALANAGGDTINAIKQAAEFGMAGGRQELAAMAIFLSDVHSLGLETAQGLKLTTWFYWDLNDTTRAFAKRFAARRNGQYPSMGQAGTYAASLLYLKAAKKAGSATDGAGV